MRNAPSVSLSSILCLFPRKTGKFAREDKRQAGQAIGLSVRHDSTATTGSITSYLSCFGGSPAGGKRQTCLLRILSCGLLWLLRWSGRIVFRSIRRLCRFRCLWLCWVFCGCNGLRFSRGTGGFLRRRRLRRFLLGRLIFLLITRKDASSLHTGVPVRLEGSLIVHVLFRARLLS